MLARRLRRRANIKATLGQRLVFAGWLFISVQVSFLSLTCHIWQPPTLCHMFVFALSGRVQTLFLLNKQLPSQYKTLNQ